MSSGGGRKEEVFTSCSAVSVFAHRAKNSVDPLGILREREGEAEAREGRTERRERREGGEAELDEGGGEDMCWC
eukprot:768639-Hanusia_phi.AAC.4